MNRFDGGVFLENIEWFDETGEELVHRLPQEGSGEIKYGAQLTVRESQVGVLFYKGKACDCFGPGRHTLKTFNLPILTKLLSIPWRGDSPLRAEVYMVNMKTFTNLKWGTRNPIAFRDRELGLVRLRAHGIYNLQVLQPVLFINSLVGTMGNIDTEQVGAYLKRVIVSRFNDFLGKSLDSLFDLPGKFDPISVNLQKELQKDFNEFGLRLNHLFITSITPPEEVQSAIDDKSRMGLIQDMDKFMQLKAAMAIEKASENTGEAGSGLGLGLGMMMPSFLAARPQASEQTQANQEESAVCPECQHQMPGDARFCPHCGHQQVLMVRCHNCGKNLTPSAKFCSRCGVATDSPRKTKTCKGCGMDNLAGAMFCNQCGDPLE